MFLYSNPVPPESFVGRRRELSHIASRIANHGQSTALIGEPRTGKTSLLSYLASPLGAQVVQSRTTAQLTFVYLDAHSLPAQFVHAEFWASILEPVATILGADYGPRTSLATGAAPVLDNRAIEALLGRVHAAGRRLVALIDEFDVLAHQRMTDPTGFFGSLRSLTTRSRGALTLVLASRRSMRDLEDEAEKHGFLGSPCFNFVSEVNMGPLSAEEVDTILNRGAVSFTAEARRSIHELSGGFPYLVQAAAGALWSAYADYTDPITRCNVAGEALRRETARTLADIWRWWPAATRHVFSAVALEHLDALAGPGQFDHIESPLVDVNMFASELDHLRYQGFLVNDPCMPSGSRVGPLILLAWHAAELRRAAGSDKSWETWLSEQGWGTGFSQVELARWTRCARPVLAKSRVVLYGENPLRYRQIDPTATGQRDSETDARDSDPVVTEPTEPVVFVSYSHDSSEHKDWVRRFAAGLVENGVDVILDQWDAKLGSDLGAFMEQGIVRSKRVLLVCSTKYVERANAGAGGVGYEKLIVTKEVVANTATSKFVPIIRNNPAKSTPNFLGVRLFLDFEEDASFEAKFDELLRELHEKPRHPRPPRGRTPF